MVSTLYCFRAMDQLGVAKLHDIDWKTNKLASQASLHQQKWVSQSTSADAKHAARHRSLTCLEYAAVFGLTWPACWVPAGLLQAGMQGGGQGLMPASACPAA